ncbi:MAG: coproporphyrinogen III oxidase [Acidobacteria bacterium]|nr:MAG: coproporphyrinogen III oxidase [Acidobacteriota bacterium]
MIRVVEREKAVSSRESHGHQELSRVKKVTALFAPKKVLGIYIQVPFCQTKCTYCNFHTGVASRAAYAPYARAVEREIRDWRALHGTANLESTSHLEAIERPMTGVVERQKRVRNHAAFGDKKVDTIYLGGGTPSLFDPADLSRILDAVRSHFACADATAPSSGARAASTSGARAASTEVTLEADPETITPEKAAAWLAAGINRVSLGAQSFHDAELKPAGRMHRREDIFRAMAHLRAAGFANISLDLIAGLPHQTASSWQESVEEALRLRPEHISIYLFEIDEGSRLGRELLTGGARYSAAAVPSDDAMADSYEFACERLREAGYDHYEISNWALPGFRSRHNLKYWRREPYLGFGAGAHSFDGRWRWANAHDPAAYAVAIEQGRLPIEQLEEVTPKQALEEELFLGLRQLEGIDLARIEAQYGSQFNAHFKATIGARIEELRAQGLVERAGPRARLAPARLAVSNEVFVALLD